ncbi:hypothetical protein DVQ84_11285 [Yersinia enterocolitica]|nr:hypothetical protein [Yersinia enterocolitica]QBP98130.1 hypothetical protein YEY1_04485 [Yersinia enterocolitica subsp. palearctica]EKN4928813.1 hypothetical protein [Yersinia enterocolitica]EKN4932877.1 hypothetical protein [Yersinia enterocolitica]EKN5015285.1 hypothetical protein [Yersinia enterocolitica]
MPDIVAKLLFFFTSCTFTLSVHSDFMQHRYFRGAFFWPYFQSLLISFQKLNVSATLHCT